MSGSSGADLAEGRSLKAERLVQRRQHRQPFVAQESAALENEIPSATGNDEADQYDDEEEPEEDRTTRHHSSQGPLSTTRNNHQQRHQQLQVTGQPITRRQGHDVVARQRQQTANTAAGPYPFDSGAAPGPAGGPSTVTSSINSVTPVDEGNEEATDLSSSSGDGDYEDEAGTEHSQQQQGQQTNNFPKPPQPERPINLPVNTNQRPLVQGPVIRPFVPPVPQNQGPLVRPDYSGGFLTTTISSIPTQPPIQKLPQQNQAAPSPPYTAVNQQKTEVILNASYGVVGARQGVVKQNYGGATNLSKFDTSKVLTVHYSRSSKVQKNVL